MARSSSRSSESASGSLRAESSTTIPALIGVVHVRALPGSPRYEGDLGAVIGDAARDAGLLAEAGFDGVLVENFGDAPFLPGRVPAVTVAAMTACALAVRAAIGEVALGVNVLRNDAEAALAVALASRANMIRINVHTGARVTDQGLVEGRAHETLRQRRALDAGHIRLLCDVDVKHSAALASRPLADEAKDLTERGLADAVLVTGRGTGVPVVVRDLDEVVASVDVPVLVASGARLDLLGELRGAYGVVVGSALRRSGRAGDPVDHELARRFAEAFRASRR
jgi:membrane complex biogenesis BtpA family protein